MICMEVAKMYEMVKKVIAPAGAAAILASFDGGPLSGENSDYRDLKAYEGKGRVNVYGRRTSE